MVAPSPAELLQVVEPCIAAAALLGAANYSAAARMVASLGAAPSPAAAKMSILRWRGSARRPCVGLSCEPLLRLLASTRVELREGIVVLTVPKSSFERIDPLLRKLLMEARLFHVAQGVASFTIIVDEEHAPEIRRAAGEVIEEIGGQSALILISPREILETPGFVAYVTTLLALNGINVTQVVSCHTDTILILSSSAANRAFELLNTATRVARELLEARAFKGEQEQRVKGG